ncbi:hypothetical protein QBC34DRAFT_469384 [Podospora aff. communis PSN243]|uniref:Uncharacterized protein n=1 Tax=Podospora aff. communis PSN243 TaxID=3040156 RepID=A0AAV9GFP0_9PEZI|nr:hypothetical protein QBC34DRAFT_469384 [Podospora aff. communis PSN243]
MPEFCRSITLHSTLCFNIFETHSMGKGSRINWSPEDAFGASAGLEGLAALAMTITAICALVRVKIKGDAARRCFFWMFGTMGICLVAYILGTTASAIYTYLHSPHWFQIDIGDNPHHDAHLLDAIGRLLRRIGVAMCAVMLTEVARSVLSICAAQDTLPLPRSAVYSSSAIASGLALGECILAIRFAEGRDSLSWFRSPRLDHQFTGNRIGTILGGLAVLVLIFGSIAVVMTACKAAKAAAKVTELKESLSALKTAAVVFVIVRLWSITELALLFGAKRQTTNSLAWFYIADPFIDRGGMWLVLLSVYYIGVRSIEKGGLWSLYQRASS